MEPALKVVKLSSDPFDRVDTKKLDLIFQHFNSLEILLLTEVSSRWNRIIGQLKQFHQKILLKIYDKVPEGLKSFRENYTNVSVQNLVFQESYPTVDIEKFLIFFKDKCKNLHKLSMKNVKIFAAVEDFGIKFRFAQLKSLKLIYVESELCEFFFDACSEEALEILVVGYTIIDHTYLNDFKNLKELCLGNIKFYDEMLANLNELSRLRELTLLNIPTNQSFQIIQNCPKLELLRSEKLTKSLIEFLKNLKLKNFKELSYAFSMFGLNFRQISFEEITNHTNLDPLLRLPESCCDLIFQNFSWFDLQKLSKVSTLWFHTTAGSAICMSKCRFKINGNRLNIFRLDKPLRHYQHVSIFNLESIVEFELSDEQKVALSTAVIFLRRSYHTNFSPFQIAFNDSFIHETLNYKELSLVYEGASPRSGQDQFLGVTIEFSKIAEFIQSQKSLKSLKLDGFYLKEILHLLKIASLSRLIIKAIVIADIEINSNFQELENFSLEENFIKNNSVLEIEFSDQKVNHNDSKSILFCCPKVRYLKIDYLSFDSLEIIMTLKDLEKISYRSIEYRCFEVLKKSKIQLEQLPKQRCIDPFVRIPEQLHDLVIQHIKSYKNIRDFEGRPRFVLKLLEVSKTWRNFIQNSEKFNQNVFIYFVKNEDVASSKLGKLRDANLTVFRSKDPTYLENVRQFINTSDQLLISLVIQDATIFQADKILCPTGCPKLESLFVFDITGARLNSKIIIENFRSTNLTYLSISRFRLAPSDVEAFTNFLISNHKLKTIILVDFEGIQNIFLSDISRRIHFKLETLSFPIYENIRLRNTQMEINFIKFLATQSSSLNRLNFIRTTGLIIAAVFKHLVNLKYLRFFDICGASDFTMENKEINERLENLMIPFMYNLDFIKPYLECAPNLNTLYIGGLSDSVLQYCGEHMKILQKLFYQYTSVEIVQLEETDIYRGISISKSKFLTVSEDRQLKWMEQKLRGKEDRSPREIVPLLGWNADLRH